MRYCDFERAEKKMGVDEGGRHESTSRVAPRSAYQKRASTSEILIFAAYMLDM
jgi:hypothetical protein